MKKIAVLLFVVLFAAEAFAQSGRKVQPKPRSTPEPAAEDRSEYSESSPASGPSYSRGGKKKSAPPADAVKPKEDTSASGDEDVIRVSTDLITIPVSVYERSGVYLSGLRRNDFKIFEDGKEQQVAYFGQVEKPFSVILLIDVSGSTDNKIRTIQESAMTFIDALRPIDKVMVMEFDESTHTLCDFTSDRAVLEKAVRKVGSGGGTALYDAVKTVLEKKLDKVEGKKAVVLFTDGVDTSYRDAGYEKTLALAEEGDAIIYSVYYNTFLESRGIGGNAPMSGIPDLNVPRVKGLRAEDYARGRAYLEELARLTGGKMFRSEATTGGLSAAFEGIANELGNQYTLGYYPEDAGKPGQKKTLKVRVDRPNVAIRARDNYIVGAAEAPSK